MLYDVCFFDITDGTVPTVVLLDESMQLHFIKLEELDSRSTPISVERKAANIWKYRLNHVNAKHRIRLTSRRFDGSSSNLVTIPPEFWMNDYRVIELVATSESVMMLVKSKSEEDEKKCIVTYNMVANTFKHHDVSFDTCLCPSNTLLFPTLLVTSESIAVGLNGTSQEQLIDIVSFFSLIVWL